MRHATRGDLPTLEALIRRSVHGLMDRHLTPEQMQVALGTVLGVDPQIVDDGTYFVVEHEGRAPLDEREAGAVWSERRRALCVEASEDSAAGRARGGSIVGAGGWSRLRTLYGVPTGEPQRLDPRTEPARIRAFFIDPDFVRQGIATLILERAEDEARAAGFHAVELMATPTGIAFYRARGYQDLAEDTIVFPDGKGIGGLRMRKAFSSQPSAFSPDPKAES